LLILPVHFRAFAILGGQLQMIENPAVIQELAEQFGILRQLQGQDTGATRRYLGAFHWVIIHEDEAIQSQLQFASQRLDVFGFGLPVSAPGGEILKTQGHFKAPLKNFANVRLIVLAANAEQHPGFMLGSHEFLQRYKRIVQADTHRPFFRANSGP